MTCHAVLSMDIEDWYHLGILEGHSCDQSYTILDGLDRYIELLESHGVPASFFCLGELAGVLKNRLRDIHRRGWEIGSHSFSHRRQLLAGQRSDEFAASAAEIRRFL